MGVIVVGISMRHLAAFEETEHVVSLLLGGMAQQESSQTSTAAAVDADVAVPVACPPLVHALVIGVGLVRQVEQLLPVGLLLRVGVGTRVFMCNSAS